MLLERCGRLALLAVLSTFVVSGCQRRERLLDIETPGMQVEVDRSDEGVDVKVQKPYKPEEDQ